MRLFDSHFSGRILSRVELQVAQMYGPLADSDGLLVSVVALRATTWLRLHLMKVNRSQHLVNCFEREQLVPFPLAPPEKTVH